MKKTPCHLGLCLLLVGCGQALEPAADSPASPPPVVLFDAPGMDVIGNAAPVLPLVAPPGMPTSRVAPVAQNTVQMTPEIHAALEHLNELVHVWYVRNQRFPASFEELAAEGMTDQLPVLPPNHSYRLEPSSHQVVVAFGQ